MGQKRVTLVDLSKKEQSKKVSQKSVKKSVKKVMKTGKGSGRLVDKGEPIEDVEIKPEIPEETTEAKPEETVVFERKPRVRSRRYKLARSMVDRTILYPLDNAIELVKKTSVSRFDGTISAHFNLTEQGLTREITFPHPTGKQTRVAIATDALIKKIEAKKIDFDILLASPDMMPKITKVAKILGPMGLMPNPKNKTITDDPKKRKKQLESGATQLKTESKAPLMHVVIGKTSHKSEHLISNIETLTKAINPKNIKKLTLASTMGPGVKVDLADFEKTQ